ncbi:hypothetical protein [Flavobacteriaceae bacterium 14752]|uniref:hypothetical protein n=1 Tax=Mesohalobacter salilacus TaxID=2491711 RepID=UPI000F634B68|nr:hypothetical protein EIG84_05875 [Flavobacteriaceae bacterium 14752]
MDNLRLSSVTLKIPSGEKISNEAEFETIHNKIVGYSTHTVKKADNTSVKLTINDNGNEINRPHNTAFSETSGRSSFMDALIPTQIDQPGRLSAVVKTKQAVANDVIVEVLIASLNNKNC